MALRLSENVIGDDLYLVGILRSLRVGELDANAGLSTLSTVNHLPEMRSRELTS